MLKLNIVRNVVDYHLSCTYNRPNTASEHVETQPLITNPGSWLEISVPAFNHNIACYRSLLGADIGIAVVIKSNGYGHGLQQMATLCQANDSVSWICTATLSEALIIRLQGITKPILVTAYCDAALQLASTHHIALAIHDEESAYRISSSVTNPVKVHIKIDTGLSRFGLDHETCLQEILRIARLPNICIQGIYTHYSESGSLHQATVLEQTFFFDKVLEQVSQAGLHIPIVHAAKSVVAARIDKTRYSLVRLGAGAYGLCSKEIELPLQQVLTWKSSIIHVRTVRKGAGIGYNRTFIAPKDMRIALIPVGYYEGYPLSLSNKGKVFIPRVNLFVPVVGRVCMNQIMIDVSDVASTISIGDHVELIADRDGIRSCDVAQACATNNERELLARLNPLLHRNIITQ